MLGKLLRLLLRLRLVALELAAVADSAVGFELAAGTDSALGIDKTPLTRSLAMFSFTSVTSWGESAGDCCSLGSS
jgi:hypothetical protein